MGDGIHGEEQTQRERSLILTTTLSKVEYLSWPTVNLFRRTHSLLRSDIAAKNVPFAHDERTDGAERGPPHTCDAYFTELCNVHIWRKSLPTRWG